MFTYSNGNKSCRKKRGLSKRITTRQVAACATVMVVLLATTAITSSSSAAVSRGALAFMVGKTASKSVNHRQCRNTLTNYARVAGVVGASVSAPNKRSVFFPPPCSMQQQGRLFATTTTKKGDDDDQKPKRKVASKKTGEDDSKNKKKNAKSSSNNNNDSTTPKKKQSPRSKKFTIAEEITQANIDKLAKAFDELAQKEGFSSADAFYADHESFEDDFLDDDFDDDDFDDDDELDGDDEGKPVDFDDDDDDDDPLFFGGDDGFDDMDARIAAAKKDMSSGRVTVPTELDDYADTADLESLGFVRENLYGENDEQSQKKREQRFFKVVMDSMVCPACGSDFQCQQENRPGYLPPEKFDIQVKLNKIEELQKLKEKATSSDEWSAEDEVEFLIQTAGKSSPAAAAAAEGGAAAEDNVLEKDIDELAEELELDLEALSKKKVICKRCHGLQNFGKVEDSLRPGWTDEPLLSQEKFRQLLRPIRDKPAVIVALVDLFDFSGSVLPELDNIAGDNPVILAANKADLMPSAMGQVRVESWVRRELEYAGIRSLANIGGAVRLISCKTGFGVEAMLDKAQSLAEEMDCPIYLVGAANAGKSTLLNRIIDSQSSDEDEKSKGKKRAGNQNKFKGAVTTSPLPGTTLKFIKVDLGDGRLLYDTPGLLIPGTLTQLLTPAELKIVVPTKRVEPITFRVASGKCVLVGGLARIEVIGDCKPFLFTFYVANGIKLHPTDASRADDFIANHAGGMLTPPLPPGDERMEQIGEFTDHILTIDGLGWKEAAADITLTGLGWVAVTGAGTARVKISVPKGIGVSVRPPLMPFDIWEATAKYTGGKAVRRTPKNSGGKKRRGVGRN